MASLWAKLLFAVRLTVYNLPGYLRKRLGTMKLRRLHTSYSSLSRHKDHKEEAAIRPLR